MDHNQIPSSSSFDKYPSDESTGGNSDYFGGIEGNPESIAFSIYNSLQAERSSLSRLVQDRISSILSEVSYKLGTTAEDLEADITFTVCEMLNDFESRVVTSLYERLLTLESDLALVQNHQGMLENRIDYLERTEKSKDIIVTGVPLLPDEDLELIYKKLCEYIFLKDPPTLRSIFRSAMNVDEMAEPSITMKFEFHEEKNRIMAALRKRNKECGGLRLADLGISAFGDPRYQHCIVYVNENLTARNYAILRRALDLKREQYFTSVFTVMGRVHVRFCDQTVLITRMSDFDDLFRRGSSHRF